MPTPEDLDEHAVEAFLAGRSAAAGVGPLALFAEDLRVAVSGPAPAPAPQLARLLAEGLSIEDREAPATAGPAHPAAPETTDRPRRIRKMTISELLTALAAKLGGLGLAAKAALGLGLATATATAAGAAGVLPAPAQHALATVVNATPLHIPDGTDGHDATETVTDDNATTPPAVSGPTTTVDTGDVGTGTGTGGQPADTHGACVSGVAQSAPKGAGVVHGEAVSAAAKSCPKGAGGDEEATTTTTTTTIGSGAADQSGQDHGQSGQDHGQSGQDHGQSGQDHGQSGQDHGGSGRHAG
jgi:hypothetical protein